MIILFTVLRSLLNKILALFLIFKRRLAHLREVLCFPRKDFLWQIIHWTPANPRRARLLVVIWMLYSPTKLKQQSQFSMENTLGSVGPFSNHSFCAEVYQTPGNPGFTKPHTSPEETNPIQLKPLKFICLHGTDTYPELRKRIQTLPMHPERKADGERKHDTFR